MKCVRGGLNSTHKIKKKIYAMDNDSTYIHWNIPMYFGPLKPNEISVLARTARQNFKISLTQ